MNPAPRGLYAITSQAICADAGTLLGAADAALDGGAVLLQYRDKWNAPEQRESLARVLLVRCRARGVPLIINDDAALAARIGADGVHLGAADGRYEEARALLGAQRIIGLTCSNSLDRVNAAAAAGADYVALGRFYPSRTKPDAPQAPLELAAEVRRLYPRLPLCAIGGITPQNAHQLIAAGVDWIAAVEGVFGAQDIRAAARDYRACFTTPSSR